MAGTRALDSQLSISCQPPPPPPPSPTLAFLCPLPKSKAWAKITNNPILQHPLPRVPRETSRQTANIWGTPGCHHRGRELDGTLRLHEFTREAEDLQRWLASWKLVVRGGDHFGEDHERVLVRG